VVGAAAGLVGTGLAVGAAGQLASAQLAAASAAGTGPSSTLTRLAQLTGHTAKNLGGATLEDVGRRLSGRAHHGIMTGRMADALQQHTRELRAEANKLHAPQGPPPSSDNTLRPA
jgi:hypothetical protein